LLLRPSSVAASAPAPDAAESSARSLARLDVPLHDVLGTDNQQVGDVSDIRFDKHGKISVGGFLGVGAKDVAVAPSAFQVVGGGMPVRGGAMPVAGGR
jgi:hypothetical protein